MTKEEIITLYKTFWEVTRSPTAASVLALTLMLANKTTETKTETKATK